MPSQGPELPLFYTLVATQQAFEGDEPCERTNPNARMAEELWDHSPAGLFGAPSRRLRGGPSGVSPRASCDAGALKVPPELLDEQVLFLSDIFPTGYLAAEFCDI